MTLLQLQEIGGLSNMHFELRDGVPFWAKYKISTIDKDENIKDIYIYSEEEKDIVLEKLEDYEIEELQAPSQEILERVKEIERRTFSKSEFERMLYEKTTEEKLQEENETMKQSIAELSAMIFMLAPKE